MFFCLSLYLLYLIKKLSKQAILESCIGECLNTIKVKCFVDVY